VTGGAISEGRLIVRIPAGDAGAYLRHTVVLEGR